jgi:DNA-directed RNA polymerase subunit M/transcription elongation factor TFIIS
MSLNFHDLRGGFVSMIGNTLERAFGTDERKEAAVVRDLAQQLETACWALVCLQLPGNREPDARTRDLYIRRCEKVRKSLTQKHGEFLEYTLAQLLARGMMRAAVLVLDETLDAYTDVEPRQRCRAMFYQTLGKDPRFGAEEPRRDFTLRLERSCYNAAIESCSASSEAVIRNWESDAFISVYSARCGTVNCNLDPDSSVVRRHGRYAIDRLATGVWSPDDIGKMTSAELCPDAAVREREEITIRSQQQVVEKTSQLYRCPKCRARNCTYREVQTRGLDEPATIFCTCKECGAQFNG